MGRLGVSGGLLERGGNGSGVLLLLLILLWNGIACIAIDFGFATAQEAPERPGFEVYRAFSGGTVAAATATTDAVDGIAHDCLFVCVLIDIGWEFNQIGIFLVAVMLLYLSCLRLMGWNWNWNWNWVLKDRLLTDCFQKAEERLVPFIVGFALCCLCLGNSGSAFFIPSFLLRASSSSLSSCPRSAC